ncbi:MULTISPECIES: accessory factor UbiK family protein [Euryhalocaulis]|uniref:accessory factor UbiK family protein n=1 Tax=Euryhalocaulis TaxID=1712422 RepID=UPI0003A4AEF1|nr:MULTISPECIES: accessory factor UbiK family protein [Euryhalocaulis]MBA4801623.1 accessory factor UbiK family protein [Euryhalocaulis sp.]
MQSKNPVFEDFANLMTNAAGAAKSAGDEMRAVVRGQMDRVIADMDLVGREEFEAMKLAALEAKEEAAALRERVDALEKAMSTAKKASPRKASAARKPKTD